MVVSLTDVNALNVPWERPGTPATAQDRKSSAKSAVQVTNVLTTTNAKFTKRRSRSAGDLRNVAKEQGNAASVRRNGADAGLWRDIKGRTSIGTCGPGEVVVEGSGKSPGTGTDATAHLQ